MCNLAFVKFETRRGEAAPSLPLLVAPKRRRKGRPRILHGLDASQRNVVMRASPNVNTPRKPLWMDALDA